MLDQSLDRSHVIVRWSSLFTSYRFLAINFKPLSQNVCTLRRASIAYSCYRDCFPVVMLCGVSSMIRDFMLAAHRHGMTDGDYVFISIDLLPSANYKTFWKSGDPETDSIAREAFKPLLQVSKTCFLHICHTLKLPGNWALMPIEGDRRGVLRRFNGQGKPILP